MRIVKRVLASVLLAMFIALAMMSLLSPAAAREVDVDALVAEGRDRLVRAAALRESAASFTAVVRAGATSEPAPGVAAEPAPAPEAAGDEPYDAFEASHDVYAQDVNEESLEEYVSAVDETAVELERFASERVEPAIESLQAEADALDARAEEIRARASARAEAMLAVTAASKAEAEVLAAAMLEMAANHTAKAVAPTAEEGVAAGGAVAAAPATVLAATGERQHRERWDREAEALVEFAESILQEAEANSLCTDEAVARIHAEAEAAAEELLAQAEPKRRAVERLWGLMAEIEEELDRLASLVAALTERLLALQAP